MGKVIISQINPNHYFCANDHCAKISEESVPVLDVIGSK
jgi:hypothetical protein